ncbi:hypothetical protein [Methylomonas koyamae]|uniref:AbiTii domain-containing protein n=1 Tax=Methylomonas koyamae TaxID=702114 RepID=UPI001129BA99|nr:hypothetical protein [Methylomonas koyamae]TPQ25760.1 hypothetical protein C2U68_13725 [Methylomonas koyamae]
MSLLREIQEAAIDSNVELAVLLRKCKVLAARLGNPEFKAWVERELSGYDDLNSLPDYRVVHVNSKGHFSGPFQSGLRNADIPMSCIPKELREKLSYSCLSQPVASMESLVKSAKTGTLQEPWNPDIVAYVGQEIYENMNCMQAWKVIPAPAIVAALDAIRNRILNFVLEIEAESPDAGEAPVNSSPVPQERVHQIFNTYITGNVQNVATGSTNVRQKAVSSGASDELFRELLDTLANAGADEYVIEKLTYAVEEMRASQGTGHFKQHYQSFMSVLADHIQVFGPVVAPYLPALAALVP